MLDIYTVEVFESCQTVKQINRRITDNQQTVSRRLTTDKEDNKINKYKELKKRKNTRDSQENKKIIRGFAATPDLLNV